MKISSIFNSITQNYKSTNNYDRNKAEKIVQTVQKALNSKKNPQKVEGFLKGKDIQQLIQLKDGLVNLKLNPNLNEDGIKTINQVIEKVNEAAENVTQEGRTISVAVKNQNKSREEKRSIRKTAMQERESHVNTIMFKEQNEARTEKATRKLQKKNTHMLQTICQNAANSYRESIQPFMPGYSFSKYAEKIVNPLLKGTSEEVLKTTRTDTALDETSIKTKFTRVLKKTISKYNEKKLTEAIPDLTTNEDYNIGKKAPWIPGLSENITLDQAKAKLPFEDSIIESIKQECVDDALKTFTRGLEQMSDYQVLGIQQGATKSEITAAWKARLLEFSPDKNTDISLSKLDEQKLNVAVQRIHTARNNLKKT